MTLINLAYVSKLRMPRHSDRSVSPLNDIISTSIRRNAASYITGALVFDGTNFIQILEGEEKTVGVTFDRIGRDERHSDVVVLGTDVITERLFGSWWMRGAERTDENAPRFIPYMRDGCFAPRLLTKAEVLALLDDLGQRDGRGQTGYCDEPFAMLQANPAAAA